MLGAICGLFVFFMGGALVTIVLTGDPYLAVGGGVVGIGIFIWIRLTR